eukprot:3783788-Pyramimonas_sp.AAC.1
MTALKTNARKTLGQDSTRLEPAISGCLRDTALAAWISAALSASASIWTASSPEVSSQVTSTSPSSAP